MDALACSSYIPQNVNVNSKFWPNTYHRIACTSSSCCIFHFFRVGKNFRLFAVKLIKILLPSWLERFLVWTCLNPSTSSKHMLWQHSARFPVPPATFNPPVADVQEQICLSGGQPYNAMVSQQPPFVFSCERACLSQTNRIREPGSFGKRLKSARPSPIFISPQEKLFCHSHVSTTFFWKIVSGKGPNLHMVNIWIFPARIFGAEVCGSLGKSPSAVCFFVGPVLDVIGGWQLAGHVIICVAIKCTRKIQAHKINTDILLFRFCYK